MAALPGQSDDFDWTGLAEEFKRNHRPHAGHFSWEADRTLAEWGVLQEFTNTLAQDGILFFRKARHRGEKNDPPDCEAFGAHGNRIGIEITELVDGQSIAAARLGKPYAWKDWKRTFIAELQKIIRRKDNPPDIQGGPYSQYILVIFSDEPWLERTYVARSIAEHIFEQTNLISRAFILLSYDPLVQSYPCYELHISPKLGCR